MGLATLTSVQTPFGCVLMFIPDKMLKATGYTDKVILNDNRKLMIYRLCGLWVVSSSLIAGYGCMLEAGLQTTLCRFLACVHASEVAIKLHGIGLSLPHVGLNVFGFLIMLTGGL